MNRRTTWKRSEAYWGLGVARLDEDIQPCLGQGEFGPPQPSPPKEEREQHGHIPEFAALRNIGDQAWTSTSSAVISRALVINGHSAAIGLTSTSAPYSRAGLALAMAMASARLSTCTRK